MGTRRGRSSLFGVAQLKLPTNNAKQIKAVDHRAYIDDAIASHFNLIDDDLHDIKFNNSGTGISSNNAGDALIEVYNAASSLQPSYTMTLTSWSYGSSITINHNLGRPVHFAMINGIARNTINGYPIGGKVQFEVNAQLYEDGGGNNNRGFSFHITGNTQASLTISYTYMYTLNLSTRNLRGILPADWNLQINLY